MTVNRKSLQVVRTSAAISVISFGSRILGFVRDMLIARYFGAIAAVDAFFIAYKIPNLLRRLFGEGVFAQAFIPVLCQAEVAAPQHQQMKAVIDACWARLFVGLCLAIIVVECFAPQVIHVIAPGFYHDYERWHLTVLMLRILAPYALLLVFVAFGSAILNVLGYFIVPTFMTWILNLAFIACLVLQGLHWLKGSIVYLAWAVLFSGLIQSLVIISILKRYHLLPRFDWYRHHQALRQTGILLIPSFLGTIVMQINIVVSSMFASTLAVGSVAAFFFAERISTLPLSVLATALSTSTLPLLARAVVSGQQEVFHSQQNLALGVVCLFGLPASCGLYLIALPIVVTLFNYGHFQVQDVLWVAACLKGFALGVPAFMLSKILLNSYLAHQQFRVPVLAALLAFVINLGANFGLVADLQQMALSLSLSLAAWGQTLLLLGIMWRAKKIMLTRQQVIFLCHIVIATLVMSVILSYQRSALTLWLQWHVAERIFHLIILLVSGIISYGVTLGISSKIFLFFYRQETRFK